MGIFDWFFKREKPPLSFDELEAWCVEREANLNREAEAELLAFLKKIESKVAETRESIRVLVQAELFNSKITEREHQIMKDNRQTYIQKAGLFLDKISSSKPGSIWEIQDFLGSFDREFETLAKGSARSYYLLSEFFRNEASAVASGIKDIEKTVAQIRQLRQKHNEASAPLANMTVLFDELKRAGQRLRELKAEEKQEESERQRLSGEQKKLEAEQKILQDSAPFHELEEIKSNLEAVDKEIKVAEESLSQDFSTLEKALKKYAKISTEEKFIWDYTSNPLASLRSDSELRIIDILEKLRPELASGRLGIKERLKEKMLAKIETLTREKLRETLDRYNSLIGKKEGLASQAASHPANQVLASLDSKHQRLRRDLEASARKIEELKRDIIRIDPERLKLGLKETAEKEFSLRITD
jgi:hypothetical protein